MDRRAGNVIYPDVEGLPAQSSRTAFWGREKHHLNKAKVSVYSCHGMDRFCKVLGPSALAAGCKSVRAVWAQIVPFEVGEWSQLSDNLFFFFWLHNSLPARCWGPPLSQYTGPTSRQLQCRQASLSPVPACMALIPLLLLKPSMPFLTSPFRIPILSLTIHYFLSYLSTLAAVSPVPLPSCLLPLFLFV